MNKDIVNRIIEEAQKYDANEFDRFVSEYGWKDWMNEFTDAEEGEVISELECKEIDRVLREIFYKAQEDLNFYFIVDQYVYNNDILVFDFWNKRTGYDNVALLIWGEEEAIKFTEELNEYIEENTSEDEETHYYKFGEATELADAETIKEAYGHYDRFGR